MTHKGFLLCLGTEDDPHVERVCRRLRGRPDIEVLIIDYRQPTPFEVRQDDQGRIAIIVDDVRIPSHALVWDRTKLIPGTPFYIKAEDEVAGVVAREWRALYQLIGAVYGDQTVNPPHAKRRMLKPLQQMIAGRAGMSVPPSVVSNKKSTILGWCEQYGGKLVIKSLSGGTVSPKGEGEYAPCTIMTMSADSSDIRDADPATFACCPHFLQAQINKAYELRVVVADGAMLAFSIDSQKFKSTQLDWRQSTGILTFSVVDLATVEQDRIRNFMNAIGFVFGSLDLIVDEGGKLWFLECNEDGQWAWLDNACNGRVADLFAEAIHSKCMSFLQNQCLPTETVFA
jgi:hypothetical protein